MITLRDRFRGCILGLACGDAIGATNEFKSREECQKNPVTGMVGGGCWGMKPGGWTDDTSMALAMGASLIEHGRFRPEHVLDNWLRWHAGNAAFCTTGRGCFDIGGTTRQGLMRWKTARTFTGPSDRSAAGNGAIMRLAPAVLFVCDGEADLEPYFASAQGALTHNSPQSQDCCRILGFVLCRLLDGKNAPDDLAYYCSDRETCERFALRRYEVPDMAGIKSTGYCIDTLEAALWSCAFNNSFSDVILTAANLGSDTDTVGAVAGQIAGVRYGESGIPAEWLTTLDRADDLRKLADDLYTLATGEN